MVISSNTQNRIHNYVTSTTFLISRRNRFTFTLIYIVDAHCTSQLQKQNPTSRAISNIQYLNRLVRGLGGRKDCREPNREHREHWTDTHLLGTISLLHLMPPAYKNTTRLQSFKLHKSDTFVTLVPPLRIQIVTKKT